MSNGKTYEEVIEKLEERKGNKLLKLYKIILNNLEKESEDTYHSYSSSGHHFSKYIAYFNINVCDFKNVPISCTIHSNARAIELAYREEDDSRYLEIMINEYINFYYSAEEKKFSPSKIKNRKKVLVFEDLGIYLQRLGGGLYPATIASLSELTYYGKEMNLAVVNSIYEYFSKEHILFKDIYRDNINHLMFLPIKINDIWNFNNKLDLLKGYIKNIELPKKINTFNLQTGYLLAKCKKYVPEKEWQKLYVLDGMLNFSKKLKVNQQIKCCFYQYYKTVCEDYEKIKEHESDYIYDYVDMIWEYSKPKKFNLKLNNINSIIKAHDKITKEMYISKTPVIKIKKNSKFKNLNLGEGFELIKTRKRLIDETVSQNHCVWSYEKDINDDYCMIYSTIYNEKRYTIEIGTNGNKFCLNQIKGFNNSIAPEELVNVIKDKLSS